MLSIGHRGAAGHAPENTIASVCRALELGAGAVEVDVHLLSGRLVVIHDDRLERTTNGLGRLSEWTLEAVRALDAGGGERVPVLEEVLDAAAGRAAVNVELKGPGTGAPIVDLLAARRREGRPEVDVLVSSFEGAELERVRALELDLRIGVLVSDALMPALRRARELDAYSLHPSRQLVDPSVVREAHARGLRVFPYTVNDPEEIERFGAMGVDGVFTDYPERVRGGPRPGRWP